MTTKTYDYSGFYTIILTENSDDCTEIITQIFEDCWSIYIANVNILVPTDGYEVVLLYTFFPFTSDNCEVIEPEVYNNFENGTFQVNVSIFPEKFVNLFNCPLRVSSYTAPPNVILQKQPDGSYYPDGIEGIMLRVISQHMNFTPIIILSGYNVLKPIPENTTVTQNKPKLRRSLEMVTHKLMILKLLGFMIPDSHIFSI